MRSTSYGVVALSLVALSMIGACSKKDGAVPTAAAKPQTKKLGKIPLQADLPEAAMINDGVTPDGVMIMGGDVGALSVGVAGQLTPATLEAAKEEAKSYSPANLKAESLADGWLITFENQGALGKNYFVQSVRKIGGKSYTCETTASQPSQQTAVAAACKSLRP